MTMLCAKLPQNVSKNRYRDISPCGFLHAHIRLLRLGPLQML